MPVIKIEIWEGRTKEEKRKIIQAVSKAVSESADIPIEYIHIIINDVPKDNWGLKGDQASEVKL